MQKPKYQTKLAVKVGKSEVFIASSSGMDFLKAAKMMKRNGFRVLGCNYGDTYSQNVVNISANLVDVIKCDAFVFIFQNEMTLWQGSMFGAALVLGKTVYCVNNARKYGVELEPILNLPQVQHFRSVEDLLIQKFPLKKQFLLSKMEKARRWIEKMEAKPLETHRSGRIRQLKGWVERMEKEFEIRFGKEEGGNDVDEIDVDGVDD